MNRFIFTIAAAAVIGVASTASYAQSANYLVAGCANCHGTDGNAQGAGSWPLAGKSKGYLVEQMAAFKAGTRQATIMHQISKGYSDDQIAVMAEYFAKQKPRP
jgi:cytochrome subunit of sulfide dehydrogenase